MYIALGQRLTTLWGRNFDVNRNILSFWSLVASLNKISFKSVFIQFFSWFYTYSPRAGADSPQGTKFWCQQKCLVTSFICLWSLILYNFFFMFNTCIYEPWGRGRQPQGDKILMSTERPYHFTHLLQVSNLLEVWFNTIFLYSQHLCQGVYSFCLSIHPSIRLFVGS